MSDIKLMIQSTPNPNALKFVTNRAVKTEGNYTYKKDSDFIYFSQYVVSTTFFYHLIRNPAFTRPLPVWVFAVSIKGYP